MINSDKIKKLYKKLEGEQMPKILIIDDDPDIVESLRIVLESRGHEVKDAASGREGIEKARGERPDLIILDIMMSKITEGFEVARELKRDRVCKDIPILMLTSLKEKTGFDFSHQAGDEEWLPVDDYVHKPISPDELLKKVDKLIK